MNAITVTRMWAISGMEAAAPAATASMTFPSFLHHATSKYLYLGQSDSICTFQQVHFLIIDHHYPKLVSYNV